MHKRIFSIVFSLIIMSFTPIQAKNKSEVLKNNTFLEIVEESKLYNEYLLNIVQLEVNRSALTEFGERHTVMYSLTSTHESVLIFVGDEYFNILVAEVYEYFDDKVEIVDLLHDNTTSYPMERNTTCQTFFCTQRKTIVGFEWDSLCNTFVGQACNGLGLIPGKGMFLYLGCKAGVILLCSIKKDTICVDGFWNNVCPF